MTIAIQTIDNKKFAYIPAAKTDQPGQLLSRHAVVARIAKEQEVLAAITATRQRFINDLTAVLDSID